MTDSIPETGVVTADDLTEFYRSRGYLAMWENRYKAVPGSARVERIDEAGCAIITFRLIAPLHKVSISLREIDNDDRR